MPRRVFGVAKLVVCAVVSRCVPEVWKCSTPGNVEISLETATSPASPLHAKFYPVFVLSQHRRRKRLAGPYTYLASITPKGSRLCICSPKLGISDRDLISPVAIRITDSLVSDIHFI